MEEESLGIVLHMLDVDIWRVIYNKTSQGVEKHSYRFESYFVATFYM